ncbi:MAG: GNAT family N-acetyltransferase [Saccharofermentans sp.]|nr:GNAT family N-acetyltransferase [Saccharofermentans sp.]
MIDESRLFIRPLTGANLDAVMELQDVTIAGLKDKTILRKNSPEILAQALSERNIALGVFVENDLIAIGIAVDPVPPETDLRTNLKKFTVDKAMDLKLIIVKEEYRGNGLQRKLIRLLEDEALKRGFTHFCTSVSPDNPHSFNNFLAMEYEFDHQEELYGGLLRNIYVKKLKLSS